MVSKVILIGGGPIDKSYVSEISKRRKQNMSEPEQMEFDQLLRDLEQGSADEYDTRMKRLAELVDSADYYEKMKIPKDEAEAFPLDAKAYPAIWPEAARLRETGDLLKAFHKIECPIIIIQGDSDPHPFDGLVVPLLENKINFSAYHIEKCGHTPWKEKYGHKEFYKVLFENLGN